MANKPTQPSYPFGIRSEGASDFITGLINHGLIEHVPGAVMTVPEGNDSLGEVSAIRYNSSTDEFEGYYSDGWRTLGGGGGRWESPAPASSYAAEVGRGYLIDSRANISNFVLPTPKKVGDAISIADVYGAFAQRPLTVTSVDKIYGVVDGLTLATASMAATFTWTGADEGWIVTSGVGMGQGRVNNRIVMTLTTSVSTSHIDLTYKPDYLDVYAAGLRLSDSKYTVTANGIDFNPPIAAGVELQIIEYTPVNLAGGSGNETFEVSDEAAMLALPALRGDIVVREDDSGTYRLKNYPASELANWTLLKGGVTKVNNRTGVVTVAEAGSNSDITRLNSLVGPLELGGDPVFPYDATTKRWVENLVSSGTVGPTMNGVMNYGVGSTRLHESRAYIPPYEVYADGQLLDRALWPELWAHAQLHGAITDAAWVGDPTLRGKYSTGNGTTTFRVPDRNGVQKNGVNGFTGADSITALYGRGDGGSSALDGTVTLSGAPNITGDVEGRTTGTIGAIFGGGSGALTGTNAASAIGQVPQSGTTGVTNDRFRLLQIDASKSNAVYGRTTSEIRTNTFFGVWVIRASGGFVAANTSWSVINGDATLPSAGVTVGGGVVRSTYKVAGIDYALAELTARRTVGSDVATVKLSASSYTTAGVLVQQADYYFGSDGLATAIGFQSAGTFDIKGAQYPKYRAYPSGANSNAIGGASFFEFAMADNLSGTISDVYLARRRSDLAATGQILTVFPKTAGTLALQGTSGREFKKDIVDADSNEALDRINSLRMVNYVYKDDEQERVRFGIIAEEAEVLAPQYVKHNQEPVDDILDENGDKIGMTYRDRPSIDGNPVIMDLLGAVQILTKRVEELEARLASS